MDNPEVALVQWEEVNLWARALSKWAQGQNFTDILAIQKGGLVPGVIISSELGLPLHTLKAQRRKPPHTTLIIQDFWVKYPQAFYLVVDDIIDEGKTMINVAKMLSIQKAKFRTVSMLYKSHSKYKPDYYVTSVKSDSLVVFPWENEKKELQQWREWNERHTE